MPTNKQRRETAKRKLERQIERRNKQAKRRRVITIAASAATAVAVVAAVVVAIVVSKDDNKSTPSASTTTSGAATSSGAPGLPPVDLAGAVPMPEFKPPANLGANCQYPATQEKAAKEVKPPRTGKIARTTTPVSVSMVTNQGHIGLLLNNDQSPCTVNNFASLAGQKFFNDTKCHRLTTLPGLSVLQCGDPKGDGTGGPGYGFANEFPTNQFPPNDQKLQQPVIYPRGTVAMAHSKLPNSNGSQFFLVYRDSALPPDYTVFGKIQDDGLATLDKIAAAGVAGGEGDGPPAVDVIITSVLLD